jgi:hypothetical protein
VGFDFLKGINFASMIRPLTYFWFDDPKKTEEIRIKEAQIIAEQEKELEKLKAKLKEEARQAKILEKERQKAEREKKKEEARI